MKSSFHKIYGLAVHTEIKGAYFRFIHPGTRLKKRAVSGSQNADMIQFFFFLLIQLNVSPCVRALGLLVDYCDVFISC